MSAPPEWLSTEQKKIWASALRNAPAGVLKKIDGDLLAAWVVTNHTYQRAAAVVAKSGLLGRATEGSNTLVQNPMISIQNRQAELMCRLAAQLGFDPTSRVRLNATLTTKDFSRNPFAHLDDADMDSTLPN